MSALDDLLPKAADCRRRIAEVEAEKATELMRKEGAADAEKRALLERGRKRSIRQTLTNALCISSISSG
jgi:uncharacterized membrane protein YqiK